MVVKNVWMVVKNVLSRVLNSLVLNWKQRDRTVWAHGEGASRATGYQEQLCLIQPDSS